MNEADKALYQQATGKEWAYDFDISTAAKFAALVRADEREACADVCDELAESFEQERDFGPSAGAEHCADAIRARGNT